MSKKQREEAFREDLAALLARHEAELEVTDDGKPWGHHSGVCRITMMSAWDEHGEQLTEYTEFTL